MAALRPRRLDLYLLKQMATPMAAALAITLTALLLERLLRLFDLLSSKGAPLALVASMALNLVPHYLGLALPAAFCVGVIGVVARLARDNELDAMEAAGWSLRRIGAAFVAAGAVLAVLSIALFGYIQPYSRYAYHAIKHQLVTAAWDARVEAGVFIDAGRGMTISAEEVDPTGRLLSRVFVKQETPEGAERILTAAQGVVIPDPEAGTLRLRLLDGVATTEGEAEGDLSVAFDTFTLEREFDLGANPFRPRGGSERELTMGELRTRATGADGLPPEPRYAAELHSRMVRALALIGVPLLAVPLAVAGKRAPVWRRVVVAVAILTAFHHLIQFVEGLGDLGRIDPALGLWGVCAVFFALGLWLYLGSASQGSQTAARTFMNAVDDRWRAAAEALSRRVRRRRAQA